MKKLEPFRRMKAGLFEIFPFGTDFTPEEIVLGRSLRDFKSKVSRNKVATIKGLVKHLFAPDPVKALPYLRRMNLDSPGSIKETIAKKVVTYALISAGQI